MSTEYVIQKDNDGVVVLSRERLVPPVAGTGGVTIVPSGFHAINAKRSGTPAKFPYLQKIEAICIADGIAAGNFYLRAASGTGFTSNEILKSLHTGKIPVAGDRFVWEFPTPIQGPVTDEAFHIEVPTSSPSIGLWFFSGDGFYSRVQQD